MVERISACICTYNRYELLGKCISSLLNQSIGLKNYKIMVMDNSPDETRALKEKEKYSHIPNLEFHYLPKPGLSNARNQGAERCGTEFIAYIDDDAVASPQWLESIVAGFEDFPGAKMVGGPINPIWDGIKPSWIPKWREGFLTIINWGGGNHREIFEGEWFAGANMAFRTTAVLDCGGFPSNLGRIGDGASLLSNEEIDIVDQIKESGASIVYAPEAKVDHLVDASRLKREWFRKRVSWQVVSDMLMTGVAEDLELSWEKIYRYYEHLSPEKRNLKAIFSAEENPDLFHLQLEAIEGFLNLCLGGAEVSGK